MKTRSTFFSFLVIVLLFFDQDTKLVSGTELQTNEEVSPFNWTQIKSNFPNRDILIFDFSDKGQPLDKKDDLPRVEDELLNSLLEQVPYYKEWNEHLEIYYFSLNIIDNKEVGIFLSVREFDGLEYNFDLIQFDNSGKIIVFQTIANSWEAAECFGYTNTKIDLKENTLFSKTTQSCFDFESEEQIVERSASKFTLEGLKFMEIMEK